MQLIFSYQVYKLKNAGKDFPAFFVYENFGAIHQRGKGTGRVSLMAKAVDKLIYLRKFF